MKSIVNLLQYIVFALVVLILVNCSHISSYQQLTLPIESAQLTSYYRQTPNAYEFYLKPEYQDRVTSFSIKETMQPIKGENFSSDAVTTNIQYFELGRFELDGYLYKLIIYNRSDDSDIVILNTQLNSYDDKGQIIDALLLDSRFEFEEFERFSRFTINEKSIFIDNYVTYVIEIVDGGELGEEIENPTPQFYTQEQYQIDHGIFKLLSRIEFDK